MTPERFQNWYDRFRYYRRPPSVAAIKNWIDAFQECDQAVAAKLLDNVLLISEDDIQRGYREALEVIPGWHRQRARRNGEWLICGLGGAGESGGEMLRKFREANRLAGSKQDYLFETLSNLPAHQLTEADTVLLVDDFSGTGQQISDYWPTHAELIGGARAYLILTAATRDAISLMMKLPSLSEVLVDYVLEPQDNLLAEQSSVFTDYEKERLLEYCIIADKARPKGYGDCGLGVILSHKTPNNSLPVLHVNRPAWRGLFPRYLNA